MAQHRIRNESKQRRSQQKVLYMSRVSDKDMNLGLICMDKIDNTYTDRKKTPLLRFIFILRILVLKFLVMLLNLVPKKFNNIVCDDVNVIFEH